jgi:hypothetical protein
VKLLAALSILASGCTLWFGGDASPPDAPPGSVPDARIVYPDAPPGVCGNDPEFRGQIVDIDATPTMPRGIQGAVITQSSGDPATGTTDANGGFSLCPRRDTFDVVMPGDYADAFIIHDHFALQNYLYSPTSFRAWTIPRAPTFYSEHGLVYDISKAHVMVFVAGDADSVSLDRPHGTIHAAQEGYMTPVELEWAPGTAGRYVWIPNVDASEPTAHFRAGPRTLTIPLAAGKITFVLYSMIYVN